MPHSNTDEPVPSWADVVVHRQAEDRFNGLYGEMIDLAAMSIAADQRSVQAAERCRALAQQGLSADAYEKAVEMAEIAASEHSVELYLNANQVIYEAFRARFFPAVLAEIQAKDQAVDALPTLVLEGFPDEVLLEA